MAYCGPRGIPYRFWLGGKHRWTDFDRAAAHAWSLREADRCPSCGLHRGELPADERHFPFTPEYHSCPGCRVKDRAPNKPEGDEARHKHFRWLPKPLRSKGASRRRR